MNNRIYIGIIFLLVCTLCAESNNEAEALQTSSKNYFLDEFVPYSVAIPSIHSINLSISKIELVNRKIFREFTALTKVDMLADSIVEFKMFIKFDPQCVIQQQFLDNAQRHSHLYTYKLCR
jgi:hypothetical protein